MISKYISIYPLKIWRKDYFITLVEKEKALFSPVVKYFSEYNDRMLYMDLSSTGLPVCQETAQ